MGTLALNRYATVKVGDLPRHAYHPNASLCNERRPAYIGRPEYSRIAEAVTK